MDLGLQGKVALVTGASQGIGRATALRLAGEGVKVALMARGLQGLEEVAAEIRAAGGEALPIAGDVVNAADRARAIDETIAHFGRLDILMNAAGIMENGSIETTSTELWNRTMELNVNAVFELTRLATPHLIESKGNIINMSSVCGVRSFAGILAYATSKAAVDQMSKCLALELAPKGVRVNALSPGVVESNLHIAGGMSKEHYAAFLERTKITHPLARPGKPEEIADAICFLVSDRSAWTTGVSFGVDGGRALTTARA